ncbi:UPF0481 protein At3g47200-like [Tripterygium wilfordii]|nr:UPF0481 protein At3g47200-like [Tripterygium wilfordii]
MTTSKTFLSAFLPEMGNGMLASSLLQKMSRRRLHTIINKTSTNLRVPLEEELKTNIPNKGNGACIYRVPKNMIDVEPKAYTPNIISIGPYHHGSQYLRKMEELKWRFFHRLFDPSNLNGLKLEPVIDAMEELETETRRCYADAASQLGNQNFVLMMLIDGCFVVELLRELSKHNFSHGSPFVKR